MASDLGMRLINFYCCLAPQVRMNGWHQMLLNNSTLSYWSRFKTSKLPGWSRVSVDIHSSVASGLMRDERGVVDRFLFCGFLAVRAMARVLRSSVHIHAVRKTKNRCSLFLSLATKEARASDFVMLARQFNVIEFKNQTFVFIFPNPSTAYLFYIISITKCCN